MSPFCAFGPAILVTQSQTRTFTAASIGPIAGCISHPQTALRGCPGRPCGGYRRLGPSFAAGHGFDRQPYWAEVETFQSTQRELHPIDPMPRKLRPHTGNPRQGSDRRHRAPVPLRSMEPVHWRPSDAHRLQIEGSRTMINRLGAFHMGNLGLVEVMTDSVLT